MKTILFSGFFILFLSLNSYAKESFIAFRPYGAYGMNIGTHSINGGSATSYMIGGQFFFFNEKISSKNEIFRAGLDFASMHAFSPVVNGQKQKYEFFNVGYVVEAQFKYFLIQAGLIFYIPDGGDNNVLDLGYTFSFGPNIPLTDHLQIPILLRFDILNEQIISMNGVVGVTVTFGSGSSPSTKDKKTYDDNQFGPSNQNQFRRK